MGREGKGRNIDKRRKSRDENQRMLVVIQKVESDDGTRRRGTELGENTKTAMFTKPRPKWV